MKFSYPETTTVQNDYSTAAATCPGEPLPWPSELGLLPEQHMNEIQLRIPAQPEFVRVAREMVDCVIQQFTLSTEARAAIKLAVGEAVNNAVLYGLPSHPENSHSVNVMVRRTPLSVEIDIINFSNGFSPKSPAPMPLAESLQENGRGLALMELMMDEVEYFVHQGHTIVRLRKHLPLAHDGRVN